MIKSDDTD